MVGVAWLFSFFQVYAQPSVRFTPATVTVDPGQTVTLSVEAQNFGTIQGFTLGITWDPAVLELDTVTDVTATLPSFDPSLGLESPGVVSRGEFVVIWTHPSARTSSITTATTLFKMQFKAKVAGQTTVNINRNFVTPDILNDANQNIAPGATFTGSAVTVNGTVVDPNGPIEVNLGNISGNTGTTVCMPVKVKNFSKVTAMQFTVEYDPALVDLVNLRNFNLAGELDSSYFNFPTNPNIGPGKLVLVWNTAKANTGVTLNDNSTIFELCFQLKGAGGSTTTVNVNGSKVPVEVRKTFNDQTNVGLTKTGGQINITGTGGPLQKITVVAGSGSGQKGTEVCIDVRAGSGFTNVKQLAFTMNWTGTVLTYKNVKDFGFTGLDAADFTASGNQVVLNWTNATGVTLADNALLFRICFTLSGNAGTSSAVNIAGGSATNASNQAMEFTGTAGSVNIQGSINPTEFAVIAGNVEADAGAEICIPVTVNGFTNIVSLQYDMSFDPTQLEFVRVQNFGLAGLSEDLFGKPGEGGVPANTITMVWIENAARGVTLTNGTVIYEVCFKTKGAPGSVTPFNFVSTGAEVSNTTTLVPFKGINGTVTVKQNTVPNFEVLSENKVVQSGQEVCLPVKVNNFTDIRKMKFEMNYNASLLEFVAIRSTNLAGLTTANFNTATAGTIVVDWSAANQTTGVSTTNGTTIFEVCLRAKGNTTATTTFQFNDSGADIQDKNGQAVTFRNTDATVTIQGGLGPNEFALIAGTTSGKIGDQVCVPVTVNGFISLVATEFNMKFDPTVLKFDTLVEVQFADLTFSKPGQGTVKANEIPILWVDGNQRGKSLNNGDTYFRACFTIIGGSGTSTPVEFFSTPAEIVNLGGQTLPFKGLAGSVAISAGNAILAVSASSVKNVSCKGGTDGGIVLNVTGGATPYTYRWSRNNLTTKDLSNVPAGAYTVTVTDGANPSQQVIQTFTVTEPAIALAVGAVVTDVLCNGGTTGRVRLNLSGGTSPYTVAWGNNLGSATDLTGLAAGNYPVLVTDANSCTKRDTFQVKENPAISISLLPTDIQGTSKGTIVATVSGGNNSFTYSWTGPNGFTATTKDISGLENPGSYTLTVRDGNQCTRTASATVNQTNLPLGGNLVSTAPVLCNGGSTGSAIVRITGGCAPFQIVIGEVTMNAAATGETRVTGLKAGSYTVTIRDACQANLSAGTAVVTEPAAITFTATVVSDKLEDGCTGSITVAAQGGTGNLTYRWDNNISASALTGLCNATHQVTITDANGCQVVSDPLRVTSFGINQANSTVQNTNCPTDATGKVTLAVSGGVAPITYEWRNAAGAVIATTKDLDKVVAGQYTVIIKDGTGVTDQRNFTVGTQSNLQVSTDIISNYRGFDVSCPTATDGRIEAAALPAGGTYSFRWSNNRTGAELTNVGAGAYTVTVTDAFGCTMSATDTLFAPSTITGIVTTEPTSCFGGNDGEARVSASGGVSGGYTYRWNDSGNQTGIVALNLKGGTVQVTITDLNGCTGVANGEVRQTPELQVVIETLPDKGGKEGVAAAIVTGGTQPYTFTWTNDTRRTERIDKLQFGVYEVMVMDANGCEASAAGRVEAEFDCLSVRTVITPDGDGKNEGLIINCLDLFDDNSLTIYNRWGQLVYQRTNYDNTDPWEGTDERGRDLPQGGYFYIFEYRDPGTNELLRRKGSLTIIRE